MSKADHIVGLRARIDELESVAERLEPGYLAFRLLILITNFLSQENLASAASPIELPNLTEQIEKLYDAEAPPLSGEQLLYLDKFIGEQIALSTARAIPKFFATLDASVGAFLDKSDDDDATQTSPKNKDPKFEVVDREGRPASIAPEIAETGDDQEKTCTRCGKAKPIGSFGKNSHSKDGLQTRCKLCINELERERKHKQRAARESEEARAKSDRPVPTGFEKFDRSKRRRPISTEGTALESNLGPAPEPVGTCKRGRLCLHYPDLGEPAKTYKGNKSGLCKRCELALRDRENTKAEVD